MGPAPDGEEVVEPIRGMEGLTHPRKAVTHRQRTEMVAGLRLAMVAMTILLIQGVDARIDPATGRIRLLFVGQWPY